MSLAEVESQAKALSAEDRAKLIDALLDTLPVQHAEITDAEVDARERNLETGAARELLHDEFTAGVLRERHK